MTRFDNFSPRNGLVREANKQNHATLYLASERAHNTVQLPLWFGMIQSKQKQLNSKADVIFSKTNQSQFLQKRSEKFSDGREPVLTKLPSSARQKKGSKPDS